MLKLKRPASLLLAVCLMLALVGGGLSPALAADNLPAPQNLAGQPIVPDSIRLTWTPVAGAQAYLLIYKQSTATSYDQLAYLTDPAASEYLHTGLVQGNTYDYCIYAIENFRAGYPAEISVTLEETQQPSQGKLPATDDCPIIGRPRNLQAEALDYTTIRTKWSAVDGAEGYYVYRSLTKDGEYTYVGSSNTTTYTDPGLNPGTRYFYKVSAYVGSVEGEKAGPACATTPKPPVDTPMNVEAQAIDTQSIQVTWSPVNNATLYVIYRSRQKDTGYTEAGTSPTNSFLDTGLDHSTTYYYMVSAKINATEGDRGGPAWATTLSPLEAPVLNGYADTPTSAQLNWTTSPGATVYRLYRSLSPSSGFSLVIATSYTSYRNTSLTSDKTYYYYVEAVRGNEVARSNTVAVTPKSTLTAPVLSGYADTSTSAQLNWTTSNGATTYRLYRSLYPSSGFGLITSTAYTSYRNTSLTTGKTYYYYVEAVRGNETARSNTVAVTPKATLTAPVLNGYPDTSTSAQLNWTTSAGATSYKLYRSLYPSSGFGVLVTTTTNSYRNTGLTSGTTYYYYVEAVRGNETARSNTVAVTPKVAGAAAPDFWLTDGDNMLRTVKWSWRNLTKPHAQYNIYASESPNGPYRLVYAYKPNVAGAKTGELYYSFHYPTDPFGFDPKKYYYIKMSSVANGVEGPMSSYYRYFCFNNYDRSGYGSPPDYHVNPGPGPWRP